MSYFDNPHDEQHVDLARDYEREQAAEARYQADLHADPEAWQYESQVEKLACPVCQSENLHIIAEADAEYDIAICLDCQHQGDVAGDFLVKPPQSKPMAKGWTTQQNLFDEEVA